MSNPNDRTLEAMLTREVDRHARLWTLRFLDRSTGALNDRILLDLLASTGHQLTIGHLRELLEGLSNGGFVTIEHLEDIRVVFLTQEGSELAKGRRARDDVARPPPP
ncbi:MAG: hypothetical protein EPO55_10240 [Reyranella sp.]|uniref:hypothetical protein n=1 Tax=Reyranella sp. TaxID=1929291 RepID=UPI0011F444F3|nr:hypothetical protein [Reyranella sp.]TAJ40111.1 MAG: hypothetical protein EPO55_10240 [Reyranella sp.]